MKKKFPIINKYPQLSYNETVHFGVPFLTIPIY